VSTADASLDRLTAALVGRYAILRPLGEGGMATVYLAEDVKHDRRVALKVLKPELAAVVGAHRFLTEIRTTANLNHPHILPLHDSGEADSFLFYVMPYVTGESLRDRLDRDRQLPVDEAVRLAVALAGALEHAHKRGVIHRDIKPANILLQDGQPLMADFGIALAVGTAGGARLTETGLSVGTPYYMSPEQATGDQPIGPSSDIFALACVLYEMLTGEPPFPGSTAQAVLGKIISGHVASAITVRPQVPANVDAALRRGLEKLAADRFPTAEAFAKALTDPGYRYGDHVSATTEGGGPWKRRALAAAVAAAAFGVLAAWALLGGGAPSPVSRYAVMLPEGHDIAKAFGVNVVLSPDGSQMVYAAAAPSGTGTQLWLRRRDQLVPTPLAGTSDGFSPAFSPDGQRVAYLAGNPSVVRVVALEGGPPVEVTDHDVDGGAVTWAPDGSLYYDGAQGLWRVPPTGGEPSLFLTLDTAKDETFLQFAQGLPNGKGMILTVTHEPSSDVSKYDVMGVDLATGTRTTLVRGVYGRYAASGHLVYVTADGTLLAAPFDQDALALTGPPVALARGVGIGPYGSVDMDVGADGTLVYVTGGATTGLARAVWVTRDGTVTPVDPAWEFDTGEPEVGVALSPDGSRLAVKMNTEAGEDIWVKELDDGPLARLTFDDAVDRRPRWSRDGARIYFMSDRRGQFDLWEQPADGTGAAAVLLDLSRPILEAQRTPDGQWFILRLGGTSGEADDVRDLVAVHQGDTTTVPVAMEPYDEKGVALSPDGKWVAYESTETGTDEVYVRPFPDVDGGKWQVSTGGGINPRWARNGRELFYVNAKGEMVVAQVQMGEGFRVGERRPMFSLNDHLLFYGPNYTGWDVAPDGQRFLMVQLASEEEGATHDLVVVENFFRELREKVGR